MANFGCSFSCRYFFTNFFDNWRAVLNGDIKWNFNLNLSAYLLGFIPTYLIRDGTERGNTFLPRYSCAMRNLNMVRYFDRDFVAIPFNLDLAAGSTSKEGERLRVIAFSIPGFIL